MSDKPYHHLVEDNEGLVVAIKQLHYEIHCAKEKIHHLSGENTILKDKLYELDLKSELSKREAIAEHRREEFESGNL